MTVVYWSVAAVLLATVAVGLWRFFRGPTAADRLMVTQLFGTTGVAVCLLLSAALQNAAMVDVALALAPLAVVTTAAFTRYYWSAANRSSEGRKIDS
ncbi:MAG: monovalent cation/H+ antiporter complex subunit F [Desulfobacterales bacterium]|jgi:multicomponent Na+:H+ antiporter subunit F